MNDWATYTGNSLSKQVLNDARALETCLTPANSKNCKIHPTNLTKAY